MRRTLFDPFTSIQSGTPDSKQGFPERNVLASQDVAPEPVSKHWIWLSLFGVAKRPVDENEACSQIVWEVTEPFII